MSATKKKNPLYVVTNEGKDVLEASNLIDAFIKKLGLEPVLSFLDVILQTLLEQVNNYAVFMLVKEFIDELVNMLESLAKKVDPVLAFSIFKR